MHDLFSQHIRSNFQCAAFGDIEEHTLYTKQEILNTLQKLYVNNYTTLLEKHPLFSFCCKNQMDCYEARLHEATLNHHTHA